MVDTALAKLNLEHRIAMFWHKRQQHDPGHAWLQDMLGQIGATLG